MDKKQTKPRADFPKNEKFKERLAAGICVSCGEEPPKKRGICGSCYNRQRGQIDKGLATEEEFEKNGWKIPEKRKGGRTPKVADPLTEYFARQRLAEVEKSADESEKKRHKH